MHKVYLGSLMLHVVLNKEMCSSRWYKQMHKRLLLKTLVKPYNTGLYRKCLLKLYWLISSEKRKGAASAMFSRPKVERATQTVIRVFDGVWLHRCSWQSSFTFVDSEKCIENIHAIFKTTCFQGVFMHFSMRSAQITKACLRKKRKRQVLNWM